MFLINKINDIIILEVKFNINNNKFIIANRCSFILFILYILTYIILLICARDLRYLVFLIIPFIFLTSLIVNLSLKYNKLNTDKINRVSKVLAILNTLFNGLIVPTSIINASKMNWNEKNKQIKKCLKNIMFFILGLILIFGLSGGFQLIIDEYNKEKEKEELQKHINNINNVINNNQN